jgi:hypothetical protein
LTYVHLDNLILIMRTILRKEKTYFLTHLLL